MKKEKNSNTSTNNLSLSGKPGIFFGIISVFFIYLISFLTDQYSSGLGVSILPISFFEILLIILVIIFLAISYITITRLNKKKRKKLRITGWDSKSKTIRKVFLFSLLLFCVGTFVIYNNGLIKYIFPLSLCIYGLSCIAVKNLSNGFTFPLGIFFMLQAFLCLLQPNIMFLIWGVTFGLGHIVYGVIGKNKIQY